jgi:ABC-2 type transport system ATP-binding protein
MKEVRDLLLELSRREQLTIFISSHLLAEIELLCGRVGIIEHGKLIAEGRVAELVAGKSSVAEVDVGVVDSGSLNDVIRDTKGVLLIGEGEDDRVRLGLDGITVAEFNRALVAAGIEVTALVPVKKSLEDLFLALTSKEIT